MVREQRAQEQARPEAAASAAPAASAAGAENSLDNPENDQNRKNCTDHTFPPATSGVLRGRILHIRGTVQTGLAPVVQIFVHITCRVVRIAVQNSGKAVLKNRLQLAIGVIRDIHTRRHIPLVRAGIDGKEHVILAQPHRIKCAVRIAFQRLTAGAVCRQNGDMAAGFVIDLCVVVLNRIFAAAGKQPCVVADILVGDRLVSRCVGCLLCGRCLRCSLFLRSCLGHRFGHRFAFQCRGQPDEERCGDHQYRKDDRNARFLKEFHACSF